MSPRPVTTLRPFRLSLEEARRGHKEGVCKPCRRAFSAHTHPGCQTGSEWGQAPTPHPLGCSPQAVWRVWTHREVDLAAAHDVVQERVHPVELPGPPPRGDSGQGFRAGPLGLLGPALPQGSWGRQEPGSLSPCLSGPQAVCMPISPHHLFSRFPLPSIS